MGPINVHGDWVTVCHTRGMLGCRYDIEGDGILPCHGEVEHLKEGTWEFEVAI